MEEKEYDEHDETRCVRCRSKVYKTAYNEEGKLYHYEDHEAYQIAPPAPWTHKFKICHHELERCKCKWPGIS